MDQREHIDLKTALQGFHRRQGGVGAINILIVSLYIGLGWLLLLHLADWIFVLPSAARLIVSYATLIALPVLTVYLLHFVLRPVDYRKISREIEKNIPEFKQEVSTAVQFALGKENRENYSRQLIADLAHRAEEKLKGLQGGKIFPVRALPFGKPGVYALLLLLIVSLVRPNEIGISLKRYLRPDGVIGRWEGIAISPGDGRAASGSDMMIEVGNAGRTSGRVEWLGPGRGSAELKLSQGKLKAGMGNLRTSICYRILLGRLQSRSYRIDCYTPLLLSDIRVRVVPPQYTGFPAGQAENQGDITALRGSRVDITAVSSLPLQEARLSFGRGQQQAVAISGDRQLSASFYVRGNDGYDIWGRTARGDTLVNSSGFRITCLEDQPPTAEIDSPEDQTMLGDDMLATVGGTAGDDLGLSAVRLGYLCRGRQQYQEIDRWSKGPLDTVVQYLWDIGRLEVLPGDSVVCWLEALDNDAVSGPKTGRSRARVIRVPTVEDIYRSLAQEDSAMVEEMKRTEQPRDQIMEEIDKLARSLKEARNMDWQQLAAAENILKKQQELAERLEQAMEQAAQDLKQRENKWNFDPETMEKLAQLREMFDQVATDQMRRDMERLRQALDRLDKREVGRALENLQLSQEDFQRQLDQALQLMKELRQEQQMEKLERQLQDLTQRQSDLKSRTEGRADQALNQRLSEEQKQLAGELGRISEALERTAGEMGEADREAADRLKDDAGRLQQKQTGRKMEKASQALADNDNQQAADLQRQVLSELSAVASGLQSARSSMRQARNQAAARAIRQRARDLLDLSRQQESLNQSLADGAGDRNDLANQQQIMRRQAERIGQELDNMARRNQLLSPRSQQMLQEAVRQMDQSAQAQAEGRGTEACRGGQKALASLNGAAISLMESASGSGNGSGDMLQELSGLSGQQQAVNDATGAMLPMPQEGGGRLSQQTRSQMSRLAAQQEAVRQGMEEFNEKYGGRRDKAGRLDDLVEDMKKVIADLKKQQIGRQTIERQERILTRMLDVQRSLKERDFSKERKAERGTLPERTDGPADADKGKWTPQGLPAWKDWRQEYYPLEYKEILEEYFRSLGQ